MRAKFLLALEIAGIAAVIAGVNMLFGFGWALVAGGAAAILVSSALE